MKWLRCVLPAICLGLGPALVAAQEPTTITGRVTDEAGAPLAAASVYISALNLGSLTSPEGRYVLVVPASRARGQKALLVASQLGHRTESISLTLTSGRMTQDFRLAEDPLRLDELVVTGQGTSTTRQRLATAISTVQAADLQKSMEANVVEALAAKAPGVQVTQSGGDPGAGAYIQIRGATSITGGTQPLFVVDGTPIDNSSHNTDPYGEVGGTVVTNRAADLNPTDIEHVEILKGAGATAIYGSRAANGVVLITTRSGSRGRTEASLTTTYGNDDITSTVPLQTTYGQGSGGNPSTSSRFSWGPKLSGVPVYDHASEMYRTGHRMDTNLTLSGGAEGTTYYLSLGRMDQSGTIVGPQAYHRTSMRLKGSQVLLQNLTITGNVAYAASNGDFVQQGSNTSGIQLGALRSPPDFNQLPYRDPATGFPRTYRVQHPTSLTQSHGYDNPFWVAYEEPNTSKVGRMMGNIGATYDPTSWLKINYLFGADYSSDDRLVLFPKGSDAYLEGEVTRATLVSSLWDSNLTLTATGNLFSGVSGHLTVGQNLNENAYYRNQTNGTTVLNGTDQINDAVTNVGAEFRSVVRTDGYFAAGDLSFGDQFAVNGTIRRDGSNTFGGQNHFWYPGIGAAWTFTKNKMFEHLPLLNYGKLRANYGQSGRQPPVYSNVSSFSTGSAIDGWITNGLYSLYNGKEGVFTQGTLGNNEIKPELLKEFELGGDLAFLDQRVQAGVTYYNRKTEDAIIQLPLPPTSGYYNVYRNAAAWNQHGWELSAGVDPFRGKQFQWHLGAQWSAERSCVNKLSGATNFFVPGGGFTDPYDAVVEPDPVTGCHPFGVLYGSDFVRYGRGLSDQNTGETIADNAAPKGTIYVGADGYPQYDPEQRVIADPSPKWMGSLRSTFTIRNNLTISALIDIVHGGDRWNGTLGAISYFGTAKMTEPFHGAGVTETYAQYCHCKVAGPGATTQALFDQTWFTSNVGSGFTGPAAAFIENGGFTKLRDISISYTLGRNVVDRFGMSRADITLSGRNLYTWTRYVGIDPESNLTGQNTGRGLDYFTNPQTRSLLVTVALHR